jgi:hypothetical protein
MAAFVNREHAFAKKRPRSAEHSVLFKGAEQFLYGIVQTVVDERLQVCKKFVVDLFATKIPDDGAKFEFGVE